MVFFSQLNVFIFIDSSPSAETEAKADRFCHLVMAKIRSRSWDSSESPSPVPATPEPSKPMESSANPFESTVIDDDALPPGEEGTAEEEDMEISFTSEKDIELSPNAKLEYSSSKVEDGSQNGSVVKEENKTDSVEYEVAIQTSEQQSAIDNIKEELFKKEEVIPTEQKPSLVQQQETPEEIFSAAEETVRRIVDVICSQEVDNSDTQTMETMDDSCAADVDPVAKAEMEKTNAEDEEIRRKVRAIMEKAAMLLENWKTLKDMFKIPKKERNLLRAEHEREADRAAAARLSQSQSLRSEAFGSNPFREGGFGLREPPPSLPQQPPQTKTGYHSSRRSDGGWFTRPVSPPGPFAAARQSRERRISRFDDQTGLLHKSTLSREHRRQLFMLKAQVEEDEKSRRRELQKAHENKCFYLDLPADTTATFPEYPEFYLDRSTGDWVPMPEPYPKVDVVWGYPRMAHLPLEAFTPDDPPFSPALDPAYVYPPGVVPVSFLYGIPLGDDPEEVEKAVRKKEAEESARQLAEQARREAEIQHQQNMLAAAQAPPLPQSLPFLSSDPVTEIPFLKGGPDSGPVTIAPDYDDCAPPSTSGQDPCVSSSVPVTAVAGGSSTNGYGGGRSNPQPQIRVKLPPRWRWAKDAEGRMYYYNTETKEAQWEPPKCDGDEEDMEVDLVEHETASVIEVSPNSNGDDEDNSDDDDDEDEDEENGEEDAAKRQAEIEILSSDLSAQEKDLLLTRRKKTKAERQLERRQKREMNREKREYERKRRRERHRTHRKSGLVKEHYIPVCYC